MTETLSGPDYAKVAAQAINRSREMIAQDPQLKAMMPDMALYKTVRQEGLSCDSVMDQILSHYSDRQALGMRRYDVVKDTETQERVRSYRAEFDMMTYGELRRDIHAISNSWRHVPALSVARDEFVAIFGFASSEYTSLDCALCYTQAVSVPLQSASSGADLDDIFTRIAPACVAASFDDLESATTLAEAHSSVRSFILFDYDARVDAERKAVEATKARLSAKGIRVLTYAELVEAGQAYTFEFLPPHPEGDEALALIIHSSGSTGVPKGAMMKAGTVKQYWVGNPEKYPTVGVIFSPLNHVLGRATVLQLLGKGSVSYFTLAPDMSTLFEDIRISRPTNLTFFPRVLDMIYQHYQNEVVKEMAAGHSAEAARSAVMAGMKDSFLGDRLTSATVGSAPTSQAVKDFMAECFGVRMWDGYGSTEAGLGSVTVDGHINRRFVLDYKLRDVPELGYYTTDKPFPRGELCFKGRNQIKGFYKDPEATKNLLTDDGFIITGDIVEERKPDQIVIVDRRKDVVKLSQGEYVAVGPLGAVFEGGSPYIKQIYIFGNSHRSYLVAVVVPDREAIEASLGHAASDVEMRGHIRQAIQDVAKAESLKSFEAPRDFILEHTLFSQENGLLSSVRKKLRPALKRQYGEALEALYAKHEESRDAEITALKNASSGLSGQDTFKRLVGIHLGLEDGAVISEDKNFGELGGDSLGAVNFSLLVEDVFGVIFPADKILDPTANIIAWAKDVERLKEAGDQWASFASIHGAGNTNAEAKDLTLEAFLPTELIAEAPKLPAAPDTPKVVLLTGATGFLGRHVCLEWLSTLNDQSGQDGQLICLVRAKDDEAASARLKQVFENSSSEMRAAFEALSKDRLTVLAADIAMPNFGLTGTAFTQLTETVDRICHVGALVNHRLSYEHLFAPNVNGTAEIIKLAITHKRKAIDFVSTVSVLPILDRKETDKEIAHPMPKLKLSDAYASGYAASKWAAEILLRRAAQACEIPANILRGNMMLAHREYVGAINPSDMFTRLLFSLIASGVAPKSFYSGRPVNYDGLPVDLVAASVVNVCKLGDAGVTTANIHNYNSGEVFSLDAITTQLRALGHEIEVIEDYGDWFQRFSERLHTLPDTEKQKSAIDLLPAFKHPQLSKMERSFNNFKCLIEDMEGELPVLTSDYVSKILQDLKTVGIVEGE
ncbi:MAG: thioester reductase domain-containing protein [Maricaulaceae bacterium]